MQGSCRLIGAYVCKVNVFNVRSLLQNTKQPRLGILWQMVVMRLNVIGRVIVVLSHLALCCMKHWENLAGRFQQKQRAIIKPFTRQPPAQFQGNEQGSAEAQSLWGALHLPLPLRQNKGLPKIQRGRASSYYMTQSGKVASSSAMALPINIIKWIVVVPFKSSHVVTWVKFCLCRGSLNCYLRFSKRNWRWQLVDDEMWIQAISSLCLHSLFHKEDGDFQEPHSILFCLLSFYNTLCLNNAHKQAYLPLSMRWTYRHIPTRLWPVVICSPLLVVVGWVWEPCGVVSS